MDIKHLKNYTFAQVKRMFHNGIIGADTWEEYCRRWRNSTYRYSSIAQSYQEEVN